MIENVKTLLDKITFIPYTELKLALIGAIVILIVFFITLAVAAGSKMNGLRKQLIASAKVIGSVQAVTEENVEVVYNELKNLPEPVSNGWGCFMDQRIGYPSDYIPARDVLENKDYKGKNTVGKVILNLVSLIVLAFIAYLTVGTCSANLAKIGIADFTENFSLVFSIIDTILVPILAWLIATLLLGVRYSKQRVRLEMAYASFQDILDEKVVVYASDEEEFVGENLEEIKKKVDELVANRLDDQEIIEVVTAPKIEEAEYIPVEEPEVEEEVEVEEPAPVVEEVVATEPEPELEPIKISEMTKEEEMHYLEILLDVVGNAINDSRTTSEDLESIARLILTAKNEGFKDKIDQDILDACLEKIADSYFA